jgi:hypothetical protein
MHAPMVLINTWFIRARALYGLFCRGRDDVPARLGRGRRFVRPEALRQDSRLHDFFYTWGGVLGPVIAGGIFDRGKTYEPLLWSLVVLYVVAGLFYASLNRSWQKVTNRREA